MPRAKKFGHQKRRLIRKKTSVCVVSEKCDVSSSKKKIEKSKGYFDYEDNFSAESQSRFVIIDLNMLNDIFNNIAKCRYCDRSFCFDVAENKSSRRGLASSISATCKYCGSSHGSMTSNSVPAGYEVNLRFVYGMRCIGIGKSAAQTFCALMNLPPPPAKFERLYTPIFNALETASSRSMDQTEFCVQDLDLNDMQNLRKRAKHLHAVKHKLKTRFQKEYISILKQTSNKVQTPLSVGDIVLISLDNKKRVDWPLAKIVEIYKGRDGVSRVARLKTQSGELIRPIQRLCRLETSGKIAEIMREPITTRRGRTIKS
ncbi:uncharacterized protein TNCT_331021 [Trichonephila clavata]|uniref:DUF5641 domain-containing protein n=1 Tax=Trichonephila clavata TaxID=2740835 RepID=A0A8X6KMT8_TRICU|nr:uncharacterized protein TNCT_331021 [Trichonephila clavata]